MLRVNPLEMKQAAAMDSRVQIPAAASMVKNTVSCVVFRIVFSGTAARYHPLSPTGT